MNGFSGQRAVVFRAYNAERLRARERRARTLLLVAAVIVGCAGAVLIAAMLVGCGGEAPGARGVHCTVPPDSGIIPHECVRVDIAYVCCPSSAAFEASD
jgi:hypothetical protein